MVQRLLPDHRRGSARAFRAGRRQSCGGAPLNADRPYSHHEIRGYPDLYVAQYADWSFERNHPTDCTADGKRREICTPKRFKGLEHKLFRNKGDGTFEDVSKAAGLRVARVESDYEKLTWLDERARQHLREVTAPGTARFGKGLGVLIVDVNGDGKPDIYVANSFADISAQGGPYFQERHLGRGAVLADFDNDGRVDLAVSHLNGPVAILHNQSEGCGNRWLGLQLQGVDHRDVVGARMIIESPGRKLTRFAKSGGSYFSSSDPRQVIGVGPDERVERVTVIWPSGRTQEWRELTADRYWRLIEGKAETVASGGKI